MDAGGIKRPRLVPGTDEVLDRITGMLSLRQKVALIKTCHIISVGLE